MKYLSYVNGSSEFKATDLLKVAEDLGNLLDNPLFQINLEGDNWGAKSLAEIREKAFHDFCAICLCGGVEIPLLERELYAIHLPSEQEEKDVEKVKVLKEDVFSRLRGQSGKEALACRALTRVLEMFPSCGGYDRIELDNILAVINANLVALGLAPIRPDYKDREVESAFKETAPANPATVLIVDDDLGDLLKTSRALVGWPDLAVDYLHCDFGLRSGGKDAMITETAEAIIEVAPEIVLMDQGIPPIDGHEVVRKVKELASKHLTFVGNTGGSTDELDDVGCLANCSKGRYLDGVRQAVRYLR